MYEINKRISENTYNQILNLKGKFLLMDESTIYVKDIEIVKRNKLFPNYYVKSIHIIGFNDSGEFVGSFNEKASAEIVARINQHGTYEYMKDFNRVITSYNKIKKALEQKEQPE